MSMPQHDIPMVELTRVTHIYPPDVVALEDISLRVTKGEMVFLTGISGAGKTSLLKLICCIDTPAKGLIEVAGKDLSRLKSKAIPRLRQQIGVAYQDFKLLPDRTVAQNVAMALEVTYHDFKATRRRVTELLQQLKIAHKHDTPANKLSRGEQQRVAIARALANAPALLLVDEPTGNLDPAMTRLVINLLEQYSNAGATVIIATHDETIYKHTSHRVLEIYRGRLSTINDNGKSGETS